MSTHKLPKEPEYNVSIEHTQAPKRVPNISENSDSGVAGQQTVESADGLPVEEVPNNTVINLRRSSRSKAPRQIFEVLHHGKTHKQKLVEKE